MKERTEKIFAELFERHPILVSRKAAIFVAYDAILDCYEKYGGKVLTCGNGGSASDAEHITGELMKGFILKRTVPIEQRRKLIEAYGEKEGDYLASNLQRALPAISLVSQTAISTAFMNDVAPDMTFAQQVYGYGAKGDVLMCISTSGNSRNIVNAAKVARTLGVVTVAMTGEGGGKLRGVCDITIDVPVKETYLVQEYHLPIYHALCAAVESEIYER